MKRIVAALITLLVLGGVLWYGRGTPPTPPLAPSGTADDTPEEICYAIVCLATPGDGESPTAGVPAPRLFDGPIEGEVSSPDATGKS